MLYVVVDDAVKIIVRLGRGTVLAKFDLESAYRAVPVHPQDRLLLGMTWNGQQYVDGALPFGLRSAPKLFTALADGLLWIMGCHGVRESIHYLDDFLICGPPGSSECGAALASSLSLCRNLGFRIANNKVDGPSTCIPFLGIIIDTEAGVLSLPADKLHRLQREISAWASRKKCCKRQLLSLIGQLSDACRVVRPGRTFLRRMIDLSSVAKELHHRIRLNQAFRSDLSWWALFLERWNGVSLFTSVVRGPPAATLTSYASGTWGYGAFISTGEWFQLRWPQIWEGVHITVTELLPIVVACAIWGHLWRGKTVHCLCDNAAVVAILRSGTSKHPQAMHLMICLFFTASYQVYLVPKHLPLNGAADSLSRGNLPSFFQQVPAARRHPTQIPPVLTQALVLQQPDWTSASWKTVLRSILPKA